MATSTRQVPFHVPPNYETAVSEWVYKPVFFETLDDPKCIPFLRVHMSSNKAAYIFMRGIVAEESRHKWEYELTVQSSKPQYGQYAYMDIPACYSTSFTFLKEESRLLYLGHASLKRLRWIGQVFNISVNFKRRNCV